MITRLLAAFLILLAPLARAQDRPVVATVNYPLAYFTERLAGDAVEVLFPVPDGVDPAFWRPGIADIATIQQADLIVLNGAGYAAWTTRASLPRSRLVDTSRGLQDRLIETETVTHSHGADGAHSHAAVASHVWLDPALAMVQADAVAGGLVRAGLLAEDSAGAALDPLKADLAALDEAGRAAFAPHAGQVILASHPRYHYLARAHGVEVSALDWGAGEMPDDDQWRALSALVSDTGATLFLWEAAPPPDAAARLAELGLTGVVYPSLGWAPETGDFLSAQHDALAAIAAAGG
ncbi:MAG: zinc transport system substrate-binding protein [Rhodobacteraceae bacterium HLUCCA08]|nr:MAG: zinc transport system substrate-binding protein [Rhodobacteraceae bacterium HLUCCA08]